MHGRHYAGETARRLIKHAILSRLHASRALRAALRNASGRGAFCERACRALVLGLRLLSPAGADAGQLRVGFNLFARAHLMATAWPYLLRLRAPGGIERLRRAQAPGLSTSAMTIVPQDLCPHLSIDTASIAQKRTISNDGRIFWFQQSEP